MAPDKDGTIASSALYKPRVPEALLYVGGHPGCNKKEIQGIFGGSGRSVEGRISGLIGAELMEFYVEPKSNSHHYSLTEKGERVAELVRRIEDTFAGRVRDVHP